MRNLFTLDKKDYDESSPLYIRPSVRGIVIQRGKIAMVHSLKYDYYKFPGGGCKKGENLVETLIREVQEETGLVVIPSSVKEYGMVHRIQKGDIDDIFVQDNYFYFCDVEDIVQSQNLDDYEDEENFTLEFVKISEAIKVNREHHHGDKQNDVFYQVMIERDSRVLEGLLEL